MKWFIGAFLAFLVLPAAIEEEKLRDFSWLGLKAAGRTRRGEVLTVGSDGVKECLLVSVAEAGGTRVERFTIEQPGIRQAVDALKARARFEDVDPRCPPCAQFGAGDPVCPVADEIQAHALESELVRCHELQRRRGRTPELDD